MDTATSFLSQRSAWAQGQPISTLMAQALANPELVSLAAGFVDNETLPIEPTRAALARVLATESSARAALQYGTTPGYPPLREKLLDAFIRPDGVTNIELDQVVVTAGSNQLLHLIAETLLDPGDLVLCAAPTYFVFMGALANIGGKSIGVASDASGVIPEALEETLAELKAAGDLPRVKAIYLVPYFDNPRGVCMTADRQRQIVEIAKRWSTENRIQIIEDAAYRELRYAGEDFPSARSFDEEGDTVIMTGTFSKSFSPGIRVGWGALPKHLVEGVCNQKGNIDFGSPNFSQHLMDEVLAGPEYQTHVAHLQSEYSVKLQAMLSAAETHFSDIEGLTWTRPEGGLYVWLTLPEQLPATTGGPLWNAAVAEGVLYVPGEYCYPAAGEAVQANTIRLSFGVQSPAGIEKGIRLLASAIRSVLD